MPVQGRSAFSSASLRDGLRPPLTGARVALKNLPRRNGEEDAIASLLIKKCLVELLVGSFESFFPLGYWKIGRRRLRRSVRCRRQCVSALVEVSTRQLYQFFLFYLPQSTKLDTLNLLRVDQHKKRVSHEEKFR